MLNFILGLAFIIEPFAVSRIKDPSPELIKNPEDHWLLKNEKNQFEGLCFQHCKITFSEDEILINDKDGINKNQIKSISVIHKLERIPPSGTTYYIVFLKDDTIYMQRIKFYDFRSKTEFSSKLFPFLGPHFRWQRLNRP
jgi:hypothetical protein